jgi:hypothetical protein
MPCPLGKRLSTSSTGTPAHNTCIGKGDDGRRFDMEATTNHQHGTPAKMTANGLESPVTGATEVAAFIEYGSDMNL